VSLTMTRRFDKVDRDPKGESILNIKKDVVKIYTYPLSSGIDAGDIRFSLSSSTSSRQRVMLRLPFSMPSPTRQPAQTMKHIITPTTRKISRQCRPHLPHST
jgi:hypothetical protein